MGRWWGIIALAAGLATAALLLSAAHQRQQAELATPLWRVTAQSGETLLIDATGATAPTGSASQLVTTRPATPSSPAPAPTGPAPAALETTASKQPHTATSLPILLAVDPRTGLAVLQSADASNHTLAAGADLPTSHWRLDAIGPDFVELSGNHDGSRQRLRIYRQDLQRPHRLISDRVAQPVVERMILLPLQPVTDASAAGTEAAAEGAPPGTAGVPPADHIPPLSADSEAQP
jgi:hypothetical protein